MSCLGLAAAPGTKLRAAAAEGDLNALRAELEKWCVLLYSALRCFSSFVSGLEVFSRRTCLHTGPQSTRTCRTSGARRL